MASPIVIVHIPLHFIFLHYFKLLDGVHLVGKSYGLVMWLWTLTIDTVYAAFFYPGCSQESRGHTEGG